MLINNAGIASGGAMVETTMAEWRQMLEVGHKGVRVSVICPSFFRTNLCDTAIGSQATRVVAVRLMDSAPDTVDSVADKVFAAAEPAAS